MTTITEKIDKMSQSERGARKYSTWYVASNTYDDIIDCIKENGEPEKVFLNNYLASLVYSDKVIIVGCDGNEYVHDNTMSTQL